MTETYWLKEAIKRIEADIDEIKVDVKSLQKVRFKMDGALIMISALVSTIISLLAIWAKV